MSGHNKWSTIKQKKGKNAAARAKVFTKWLKNDYLNGEIGDYIAMKASDQDDVYIIGKDLFKESYELAK